MAAYHAQQAHASITPDMRPSWKARIVRWYADDETQFHREFAAPRCETLIKVFAYDHRHLRTPYFVWEANHTLARCRIFQTNHLTSA